MKKFLQTIAAVLAIAMVITSLPVMPESEAEASTGNSNSVSFTISSGSSDVYPWSDHTVFPIVLIDTYDFDDLDERLPTNSNVDDIIYYQNNSKNANSDVGDQDKVSFSVEEEMPNKKGKMEVTKEYYTSIVAQTQSARMQSMYEIPQMDFNSVLAFQPMAATLWSKSMINPIDGDWYKGLYFGKLKSAYSSELTDRVQITQTLKDKNNKVYDVRNSVVFPGLTVGYAGQSSNGKIPDSNNYLYTEKSNKTAYEKLSLDSTYNGVYVKGLLSKGVIVYDTENKGYRFNKNLSKSDVHAIIQELVLGDKNAEEAKAITSGKAKDKAIQAKEVWTYITNFWHKEGGDKTTFDSDIGERLDAYILRGMLKASESDTFKTDSGNGSVSGATKYIGHLKNVGDDSRRKSLLKAVNDCSLKEFNDNASGKYATYFCNPLFGYNGVTQSNMLERKLYECATTPGAKYDPSGSIPKYIEIFKEAGDNGDIMLALQRAFNKYSENVALYDLYYLDLMMQLYAIACANNPLQLSGSTTMNYSGAANKWRSQCERYLNVLCGNENTAFDDGSTLDPHDCGISITMGAYTYGMNNSKKYIPVLASSIDLVAAENNLINPSAVAQIPVSSVGDDKNFDSAVHLDQARNNSQTTNKLGIDSFTVTKQYCGYSITNDMGYANMITSAFGGAICVKNTEIRNALLIKSKSQSSKASSSLFRNHSTGGLRNSGLILDIAERYSNIVNIATSYKTFAGRFENAIIESANDETTGVVAKDYTASGSKTWYGYICGRAMYPMLYKIDSNGNVTEKYSSLSQAIGDNGKGFLSTVGQYGTTRGKFYADGTMKYNDSAPTSDAESQAVYKNGYGQIGFLSAIPLQPYPLAIPTGPNPATTYFPLYASLDIISSMTQAEGNAPVGDYPASLTQADIIRNKGQKGYKTAPENVLLEDTLKSKGVGYVQMLNGSGKVLKAPIYKNGAGGKGFKQDEPGTDTVYGTLKKDDSTGLMKEAELQNLLSYYNSYSFKSGVYSLLKTNKLNKKNAQLIKSVDYGIILGSTWRYLTQDISAQKEGDSWVSKHPNEAYTTSDQVALSLRLPNYKYTYKFNGDEYFSTLYDWIAEHDDGTDITITVKLFDGNGNPITANDSSYVGSDGYALKKTLSSCGKEEIDEKVDDGSIEWLLYCVREGKSILTTEYNKGKSQNKANLKADVETGKKTTTLNNGDENVEFCSFTAVVTLTKTLTLEGETEAKQYTISTVTDDTSKDLPIMEKGSSKAGALRTLKSDISGKRNQLNSVRPNPDGEGTKTIKVDADNRCNVVAINMSYKDKVIANKETEVYVHFQEANYLNDHYVWKTDSKGKYKELLTYFKTTPYETIDQTGFGKTYSISVADAVGDQMKDLVYDKKTGRIYIQEEGVSLEESYYVLYEGELAPEITYKDSEGDFINGSDKIDGGRIPGIHHTSTSQYDYKTGEAKIYVANDKGGSDLTKVSEGKIVEALDQGRVDIYIPVYKNVIPKNYWEVNVYYIVENTEIPIEHYGDRETTIPMDVGYSHTAPAEYEYQGRIYYIDKGSYAEYLDDKANGYVSYNDKLSIDGTTNKHSVTPPPNPGVVDIYIPYIRPVEEFIYHSEPEAFAELKNADKQSDVKMDDPGRADSHYQELFEAMAGVPSTELLYFAVGGSEFIVEFRAELEKEVVERTYCSHFGGNECEFKANDKLDGQSITTSAGSKEKHSDTYVTVFKDGNKVINTSTSAVNDGVSKVTYGTQTVTNEWYNFPGGTMTAGSTMSVAGHSSNTNFKFIWEGTITNADTGSKPKDHKQAVGWKSGTDQDSRTDNDSNNAYVDNCAKQDNSNAKAGTYGEPGAMGDEHNGGSGKTFNWNVDDYNKALADAVEWAKKMEAISDADGQVIKLSNSDGVTRSWHSGNATITIWFDDISVASKADEVKNKQSDGTYKAYHSKNTGYQFTTAGYTTDLLLKKSDDERLGTTWREDYGAKAVRGASSGCYGSCYDLAQYNKQTPKTKKYISSYTVTGDDTSNNKAGTVTPVDTEFTYRDPLTAAITGGRVCGKPGYTGANNAVSPAWTSCTKEVHTHGSGCKDKNGSIKCGKTEHKHGEGSCNAKRAAVVPTTHAVHTCTHTCGSFTPLVETEAKVMPTVKYHIEVTFEQPYTMSDGTKEGAVTTRNTLLCPANQLPAHALCGPCCCHDLRAIEDTWTQRAEVWSMRLTDVNVMMLDEGYVEGMSEIRKGSEIPLDEADILEALILQGQPNIFYNIAASMNGMKKVRSSDGGYGGVVIKDGSICGRLRYSLQTAQDDNVYWEEMINGKTQRTNHCDGSQPTVSVYNPAPDGGALHQEPWATGMSYSHSDFRHWPDLHKRNTSNKWGYNGYYSDNLDRLTPEWKKFDQRRYMNTSLTVISDFLILQTSSGDQSMLYYERTVNARAQDNFPDVKWSSSAAAKAAMTTGNPLCISATALNRGGYNGIYDKPSIKYRGTGGNTKIKTAFDDDYKEYGTLREVDELVTSGKVTASNGAVITGNHMYSNGNFMITGTGKQPVDSNQEIGEASSSSQNNQTAGLVSTGHTTRRWHNGDNVTRYYYRGNVDADKTDASYDNMKNERCSGDSTYEDYTKGASPDASIYHSSSPCFGQLRLSRPTHNLRLTEVFTQYIENCNKEYIPGQSHAVWHPILNAAYARDKTAGTSYEEEYTPGDIEVKNPDTGNTLLKLFGWQKDAIYAYGKTNVNNIVVHDPVSVEVAFVVGQDKALDQRVLPEDRTAALNDALAQLGHCPGTAEECSHSYLDCDYFKASGSGKAVMSVPGIKVKTFDGKVWARVLYQDISSNSNYFTSADAMSSNSPGKFSALGLLDTLAYESGKYEFLLDYPDSYGQFTGAYNEWSQTANPFNVTTNSGTRGKVNVPGYVGIHEDYWGPSYAKGLEKNMSVCILDGSVDHGNWWMCVGIFNSYFESTSRPADGYYTMPGPHGPGTDGIMKTQGTTECELWLRVDPASVDGQIAVRSLPAGAESATGANLCTSCHGECAWNTSKTCSACGNTGMGICVLCGGTGIYNGKECSGCNGVGRSFHTRACFTEEMLHDAPTTDYYNGFTAAGGKSTVYSIPGIKVKEVGGKTYARVFYQDVSANTSYVSSATWNSCNTPTLFSAMNRLDQIKYGDGYEFILDYPDSYGPFAGAYHQWRQDANPLSIAASTDGKSVAGYVEYHNDFKSTTYGGGLQQGNGNCMLDGMVGSGYWWLSVGLTANYGTSADPKPYSMPGPYSDAYGAQKVSQCELWIRVNPASYDGNIVVQDTIDWTGDNNDGSLVIKSEKNVHTVGNSCFTGNSAGYQVAYRNMLKGDYSDMHKMVGDQVWSLIMNNYSLNSWHEHDESCYQTTVETKTLNKGNGGYSASLGTSTFAQGDGYSQRLYSGTNEITLQSVPVIGQQLSVTFQFGCCTRLDTISKIKVKTPEGYMYIRNAEAKGYITGVSIVTNEDYLYQGVTPVKGYDNLEGLLSGGESSRGVWGYVTIKFTPTATINGIGITLSNDTRPGDGLLVVGQTVTTKLICSTPERLEPGTHICRVCGGTGITSDATSSLQAGTEYAFDYTGGAQYITLPAGTYKLEAWGAQGGMYTSGNQGAKGAYTEGVYSFDTPTTLYVYVGNKGASYPNNAPASSRFNGGGAGRQGGGDGGGATDFRLVGGAWNSFDGLRSRIIVAGGGGGSDLYSAGGAGGTTTGYNASNTQEGAADAQGAGQYYGGYSIGGSVGTFGQGGGELGYNQIRLTNAVTNSAEGYYSGENPAYWYNTTTIVSGYGNSAGRVFDGLLQPNHTYELTFRARYDGGNDNVVISYGSGSQTFLLSSNYERRTIRFTTGGSVSDLKIMAQKGPKHSVVSSTFWITDMVLTDLNSTLPAGTIDAGGGGGGWFGGASGYGGHAAGAGGSSYIKGYAGCNTDYLAYQGSMTYITGDMKAGTRTGNGFAKITVISTKGHDCTCPECGGTGTKMAIAPVDYAGLTALIKSNISKVPERVDGIVNPIWDCGLHGDACTKHVCNEHCGKTYTLNCNEVHHTGGHYASCKKPCLNDDNHKRDVTSAVTSDGRAVELGDFILLDNYFDVYFANVGDFHETNDHGLYDTEVPKGMGYTSPMDTTKWTREKLIRFPYPVLYERFDGEWEEYKANEWIELEVRDDNGKGIVDYHFYAPLYGNEVSQGVVEYAVEAINTKWKVMDSDEAYWKDWKNYSFANPGKYWLDKAYVRDNEYSNKKYDDCPLTGYVVTNAQRHLDLTSYHTVWKQNYIDLIGRIGNFLMEDTDDMRYSNLFKTSTAQDKWYVDGLIHEVDPTDPYGYLSWHYNAGGLATDIRGLQLLEKSGAAYLDQLKSGTSESSPEYRDEYAAKKYVHYAYDYYNTYGKLKWTEESEGAYDQASPIASSNNRDKDLNKFDALQDNELKLGYGFLWDIQTIGNYHNGILDVKPYIYALNADTGELIPADIYMGSDTEGYSAVNIFGLEDMDKSSSQYQELANRLAEWYMYFEFTGTQRRRNITKEELETTMTAAECTRTAVLDENGDPITISVKMTGPQLMQSYDEAGNEIWIIVPSRMSAAPDPETGSAVTEEYVETQLLREAVVPTGDYFRLGTMQHMYATGRARTFIGASSVYAAVIDKNLQNIDLTTFDDKRYEYGRTSSQAQEGMKISQNADANTNLLDTPEPYYEAHGQRWHLTSKLPSSAVVVLNRDGSHKKPQDKIVLNGEEIYAMDEIKNIEGKWLLVVTADITCDGEVYSLHYSHGANNGVITSKGNTYTFADGKAVNTIQTGNSFTVPTLLAVYEALESDEVDYKIMQTH